MALFPLSGTPIKGRVLVSFPAHVEGSGGISVTKENGTWTIEPAIDELTLITSASVASTHQTWAYDPSSGVYVRVALSSIVAALAQAGGAGLSFIFTVDLTSTSDSDPGDGKIRFNQANQNASTVLYLDDLDADDFDITTPVATLDDSTSNIKGQICITKIGDSTKRLYFNMASLTDASGYTKLAVTNIGSSSANPFVEGDTVLFGFVRTGDSGSSSGDVTAANAFGTDNLLLRSDGTGRGAQASLITIDDSGNASGFAQLSATGKITGSIDNATTNGVTPGLNIAHTTSGTPANGIGVSQEFSVETTAGNLEVGATIAAVVTDVTSTSEDFDLTINLMAAGATAAEKLRVKSDGTAYLAGDSGKILLHAEGNRQITEGGFTAASYNNGTKSSGTFTPDALNGNFQHCVNGGSFTLAPPTAVSSLILQIANTSGAGTITTSGFSKVNGDTFDTVATSAFECVIRKLNSYSILTITKLV